MATSSLQAIHPSIFPLFLALIALGIEFIRYSSKRKAAHIESKQLTEELSSEQIKQEQAKNCESILRLLRQFEHSFAHIGQLEEEIAAIKSQFHVCTLMKENGQQAQYAIGADSNEIPQVINNRTIIHSLTLSFDLGELILRKMRTCPLDQEDKEILRTEFIRIYRQDCKKAIDCLYELKSVLPHTEIVPYQLLDCAYTIELLEQYFSVHT